LDKVVCHSCGASATPSNKSNFIECEFCGSSISLVDFFKNVSSNTIKSLEEFGLNEEEQKEVARKFNNAEIYLESEDYEKAKELFETILDVYPQHIESRLNAAVCTLFSKKLNPLEKSKLAHNLCTKSIQPNLITPEINSQLENISYNIATFAMKELNTDNTFEMFLLSKNIINNYPPRDEYILKYSEKLFKTYEEKIEADLNHKKDKYSPNTTFLNTIINFSELYPKFSNLGLSLSLYMKDNKKNIQSKSLELIPIIEDKLLNMNNSEVVKYTFSLFGGIKKTLINYQK
tara:strand:+ start:604 stop:1473 length:870 start_codon:yes stop_codon:yes gene_type:complete